MAAINNDNDRKVRSVPRHHSRAEVVVWICALRRPLWQLRLAGRGHRSSGSWPPGALIMRWPPSVFRSSAGLPIPERSAAAIV